MLGTAGPLATLAVAITMIVAAGGLVLNWQLRQDNKRKQAAEAERADRVQESTVRIDTLTIGQQALVEALDRTEAENERLRDHIKIQDIEINARIKTCDERIQGWQKQHEAQEDEIMHLKIENGRLTNDVEALKRQIAELMK